MAAARARAEASRGQSVTPCAPHHLRVGESAERGSKGREVVDSYHLRARHGLLGEPPAHVLRSGQSKLGCTSVKPGQDVVAEVISGYVSNRSRLSLVSKDIASGWTATTRQLWH